MKALTLFQPWATLVSLGEKKIETRSWQTNYRGPLAIHAGKNPRYIQGYENMTALEPFRGVLSARGYNYFHTPPWPNPAGVWGHYPPAQQWDSFPMGEIVATCELIECVSVDLLAQYSKFRIHEPIALDTGYGYKRHEWDLTIQELAFGDYTPGRYAWLLDNIQILSKPIPAKGTLGLWEWKP